MQKTKIVSILLGSIGALIVSADAQVLRYNSEPAVGPLADGTPVTNTGTNAIDGVILDTSGTGVVSSVTSPAPPGGLAYEITGDNGSSQNLGINSNQTLGSLWDSVTRSFTASAFVTLNDLSGDNMVFGSTGASPLHLGFRNDSAYFGFWGGATEDSNGGPGSAGLAGETHHWTWRYDSDGTNGTQSVFRDGALLYSDTLQSLPGQSGENLLIGTSANSGNLNGTTDDIRFYNTALSDAQVLSEYNAALVPEPGSIAALAGGASLLLGWRRRRN